MQDEPIKAEPPKRKRRWLQFSLRTLLLLTLICAVAASWVAHRRDKKRGERDTVAAIRKVGALVYYDSEVEEKDLAGRIVNPAGPRGPEWVRELVGNDFFDDPMCVAFNNPIPSQAIKVRDSAEVTLPLVGELSELKWLFLDSSNVTDTGLESLKRLRRLRWLSLEDANITDAGLPHLAELRKLEHLTLSGTKVTDAGLAHLAELKKLEFLKLDGTKITDAGLVNLEGLDSLQRLSLRTRI